MAFLVPCTQRQLRLRLALTNLMRMVMSAARRTYLERVLDGLEELRADHKRDRLPGRDVVVHNDHLQGKENEKSVDARERVKPPREEK